MTSDDRMPATLGPYRLLDRIGEGGMGVVYLARDAEHRSVAIKVLRPAVAGDPNARRRLAREVETMRLVRSPFVAEVIDTDVTGDRPYIVTQYVPGRTLDEVVRENDRIKFVSLEVICGTKVARQSADVRVIREEQPGTAIIVLSAHVEVDDAMDLLAGGQRLGYLLKSRVTDVEEFIETVKRINAGASVVDPSLVRELVRAHRRHDPLDALSPREREVLALMAEGASNAGIARRIFVTEGTVEKHVRSILTKRGLHESETDHRRVLAVLRFLESR